jgi:hypothetical protein
MIDQSEERVDESDSLRTKLLDTEPLDSERMNKLKEEVTRVYTTKLTKKHMAWWILGLYLSVLFSILGTVVLLRVSLDGTLVVIWWTYTLSNVAMIGFSAYVLWRGVFDVRWAIALGKLSPAASLFIALLLIMQAVFDPSLPALAWSIFGILWVVIAVAITVYNRIVGTELANREQLLRLELRLVELTEKLAANSAKPSGS